MIQFSDAQQAEIRAAAEQRAAQILIDRQVEQLLAGADSVAPDNPDPAPPVAHLPDYSSAILPAETGFRTISPVPSPTTENPANAAPLIPQGGHDSTPLPPSSAPVLSPPAAGAGFSEPPPAAVASFDQQDSLAYQNTLARDYFSPHMGGDLPAPGTLETDSTATARTLAAALALLEPQEAWAPSTRGEYHGLIRRWQEYHNGAGPAVVDITEEMLLAFLDAVPTWQTHRTRNKQLTYLTKILQAVAPKTGRTKYGMRQGRAWLLEVPYVRLPKKPRPTTTQTWRLDNITVDDMARLYCVAGMMPDALRWQTLLVLVWLFGPRRADLLLMPWEALDFEQQTLSYIETKGGHPVGPLPVPEYALAHLRACRKQDWPHSILKFTRNDVRKGTNNVYPTLYRIYEQAEVKVPRDKANRRIPLHGLRAACITNWKGHAPGLQRFVTGHQHGSDVSDENYARIGGQMREQIQTLPVPDEFHSGPGATKRVRRRRGSNRQRASSPTGTGTGGTAPAAQLADA